MPAWGIPVKLQKGGGKLVRVGDIQATYYTSYILHTDLSSYDLDGKWRFGENFIGYFRASGFATNKLYNGMLVLYYSYDYNNKIFITDMSSSSTSYLWFYGGAGTYAWTTIYALDSVYHPSTSW